MKRKQSWLSQLKTSYQILIIIAATGSFGTTFWIALSSFESRTGIIAEQFGFARAIDVTASYRDLKAWQLYFDIRKLERQIDDIGVPENEKQRELFKDLKTQLNIVQVEYNKVIGKR